MPGPPFATSVLQSPHPLPSRVPLIVSRGGRDRISLAPFQAILPADDKQQHWFWLTESTPKHTVYLTYPASFVLQQPSSPPIQDELVSTICPKRSSVPTAIISAFI